MILNRAAIQGLTEGEEILVDLRALGAMWYNGYGIDSLDPPLPNEDTSMYVVVFKVGKFSNSDRKVTVHCATLDVNVVWNADMCKCWGQYRYLETHMTRVDAEFLEEHPQVMKSLEKKRTTRKNGKVSLDRT